MIPEKMLEPPSAFYDSLEDVGWAVKNDLLEHIAHPVRRRLIQNHVTIEVVRLLNKVFDE